jgi:hypothetical protein
MLDSMIETLSDSAVRLPAAALCPFVAHYAGIRAHGLPRGAVQQAAPTSLLLEGSLDLLHLFITPLGVRSLLGVSASRGN